MIELDRFVPVEYENQIQREERLTHEGEHDVHQHVIIQVNNEDDIKLQHHFILSLSSRYYTRY